MLKQELNSLPKKRSTPAHYNSHLHNLVILHISFSFSIFLQTLIFTFHFPPHIFPCVNTESIRISICMLHSSMHNCDIEPRALLRHIVDFLGSRRMETAPTSIQVFLRLTLGQSDEPSDLCGSPSPTTQHRCTHVLVYTAPGSPRRSPIQLWTRPGVA